MSQINQNMNDHDINVQFDVIGRVSSPYVEKFAIPRQPGLVKSARGKITLLNEANNLELVRGLEQFSHIWVLFVFHATTEQGWKPLVRPPRLGGNKKLGVLATRSTFRPNPIGMSVVKLDNITVTDKQVELCISGLDLLDKTPVLDIKPYIPYSDIISNAQAGFAQSAPNALLTVTFNDLAKQHLQKAEKSIENIEQLIGEVLAQDPRPAYKQATIDEHIYGMSLYHFNIKWRLISASVIEVLEIN